MTVRAGFTLVGQVAGAFVGGPVGAAVGSFAGALIGQAIEGPTRNTQALLEDLGAIKFDYGASWPRLYGVYRVKIAPIWSSTKRPVAHDEAVDSKGGPDQVNRTFTYEQDWLCWAPLNAKGWLRIWINGKLRASQRGDADDETIEASGATPAWADVTFYDGAADQLPWPVYEAAVGTADACAYRHRPTLCFASLDLGTGGQPPLIEVEFAQTFTESTSGFLESFDTYPLDWTVTNASGLLSVVSGGPWGNYMRFVGGTILGVDSSAIRNIDTGGPITSVAWTFRLEDPFLLGHDNTDDGPLLQVFDEADDNIFAFTMAREWYYDVKQRASISFGPGGALQPITDGPLPVGVWYRVTLTLDGAGTCQLQMMRIDTGDTLTVDFLGMPTTWTPKKLKLYNQFSYGGSDVQPGGAYDEIQFGTPATRLTPTSVALSDIVQAEALLEWTGEAGALGAGDIDVSALAAINVTGFLASSSPREVVAQLADVFYFGAVCSDKLYMRLRGGASVATVPAADTGAGVGQAGEVFAGLERGNDLEQAIQVAVTGPNWLADYEPGTENSDRLTGESVELRRYATAVVFTPAERKGRADTMVLDGRVASHTGQVALDDAYMALEPCDVWTQHDDEGNAYRVRAERENYADGVRTFDVVLDDPTVLSTVGITTERDTRALQLQAVSATEALLIDAPLVRDADDARGFYAVARRATAAKRWSGYSLFKSADGINYASVVSGSRAGVFGTCSVVPGAWSGPRVFNERDAIVVDVGAGTLASSTRDAMLNDASINAFAIGVHGRWLLGQFRDAALVSAGVYRLTGLLLGAGGTEQHIGTQLVGDKFALLRYADGMVRVATDAADQAATRYFKPVTVGQALSAATPQTFVEQEVGKMPLSPVDARATRAGGDITLAWQRRTRLQVRMTGPAGILVPLGEENESYAIDVYADDTFAAVVRTLTSATSNVAYSAAAQTTDFGSPQAAVSFAIHQISAAVGRGFALRATL